MDGESEFTLTAKVKDDQFQSGQRVIIKLRGDDNEYTGVMDKPRKLWVQIDDGQSIKPFVADDNCISMIKTAP